MANWDSYSGENYQIPYDYNYGIVDFNRIYPSDYDHRYLGFDPMSYYCNYASETSSASVAYSAYALSETKHVVYDPNCYSVYESESPSQFRISYSVYEFNEVDFEEYDPTPYGGGYDIHATYGKPLPPSDKTCYPCSSADPTKLPTLASVPLGSVEDSHEKDKVVNGFASVPAKETKPMQTIEEEEEVDTDEKEEEEDSGSSHGSGRIENVDEEKVKARYVPSGYGLEAMDLCETIFGGYFPCLLHKQRCDDSNRLDVSCCERNDSDPWKKTSDYLFGDLYPYGYENYDGRSRSETFYGYEPR